MSVNMQILEHLKGYLKLSNKIVITSSSGADHLRLSSSSSVKTVGSLKSRRAS